MRLPDELPRLSAAVHRIELPLVDGRERATCLLRVEDGDGRCGWGEAAPWPGWSEESIDQAEQALGALAEALRAGRRPLREGWPASVRCAWEMALAELTCWYGWMEPGESVPVAALADGPWEARSARFRRAWEAGARVCKLKVKPGDEGAARDFLQEVVGWGGERVVFRLDANRSFSPAEVRRWCVWLEDFPLEFWEEPLLAGEDWKQLPQTNFAWAWDETLRETDPVRAWEGWPFSAPGVLVLKPTLLGGWATARAWAEAGAERGWRSVVSACFESGVGIAALGQLALRLPGQLAAGLDTHSRLSRDILHPPLEFPGHCFSRDIRVAVDVAALARENQENRKSCA
jgi:O-succinylbenzoate synthase